MSATQRLYARCGLVSPEQQLHGLAVRVDDRLVAMTTCSPRVSIQSIHEFNEARAMEECDSTTLTSGGEPHV